MALDFDDLEVVLEIRTRKNGGGIFLPLVSMDQDEKSAHLVFSPAWGFRYNGARLHVTKDGCYQTETEVDADQGEQVDFGNYSSVDGWYVDLSQEQLAEIEDGLKDDDVSEPESAAAVATA